MTIAYKDKLKDAFCQAIDEYFQNVSTTSKLYDVKVSAEYPETRDAVPALWVSFSERSLEPVGLSDVEQTVYYTEDEDGNKTPIPLGTDIGAFVRWKFQLNCIVTIVALSSVDRDKCSDLFVEAVMLSSIEGESSLSQRLELNSQVIAHPLWKLMSPVGESMGQGTPWDSNQMIYESAYQVPVVGEIVTVPADVFSGQIVSVEVMPYLEGNEPQDAPGEEGGWV